MATGDHCFVICPYHSLNSSVFSSYRIRAFVIVNQFVLVLAHRNKFTGETKSTYALFDGRNERSKHQLRTKQKYALHLRAKQNVYI